MTTILQLLKISPFVWLTSCGSLDKPFTQQEKEPEYFLARVTFYTDDPKYGKKTASGETAKEGTTIAAAKTIPFGTEYYIPRLKSWMNTDGYFEVHDRGSAVCKRTASGGKYPVIDVYVSPKSNLVKKLGSKPDNVFKVYKK